MTLIDLVNKLIENDVCIRCLFPAECIHDCKKCYYRLFDEAEYKKIMMAIDDKQNQLKKLKELLIEYDNKCTNLNKERTLK